VYEVGHAHFSRHIYAKPNGWMLITAGWLVLRNCMLYIRNFA